MGAVRLARFRIDYRSGEHRRTVSPQRDSNVRAVDGSEVSLVGNAWWRLGAARAEGSHDDESDGRAAEGPAASFTNGHVFDRSGGHEGEQDRSDKVVKTHARGSVYRDNS